jgi:hypothetical protein
VKPSSTTNVKDVFIYTAVCGARGSVMVKALCYKPEGRGFDTRWDGFLNLPNPSGRTRPWVYSASGE